MLESIRLKNFITQRIQWARAQTNRTPAYADGEFGEVTNLLYARLRPTDIEAVESCLSGDEAELWAAAPPIDRKRLILIFGAYHRIPSLLRRTGLTFAEPPETVHAMSRGKLAGVGSLHYADLIMEAVRHAGIGWKSRSKILDFGCSSGRVVRVLAAAYPQQAWFGCDPNREAIAWADRNLPGLHFLASPLEPPLPYAGGMFDLVFAVSIWSHFGPLAAQGWFNEMRRILRPGGHLIFTTHGYRAIEYYAKNKQRPEAQLAEIAECLNRTGFWFKDEFGTKGDWGVVHAEWGTAFMAPDWWLTYICPDWSAVWFRAGRVEGNQDLIVLERRP